MIMYLQLFIDQGWEDQSRAVTQTNGSSEEDCLKVFCVSRSARGAHELGEVNKNWADRSHIQMEGGREERKRERERNMYLLSHQSID